MNDKIRIYTKSVGCITEITGYVGDNKVIVVSGGVENRYHTNKRGIGGQ